ncbi:potassium channel family protein [Sandaracinus amylolyticus]|uniref:Trk system potassium uptake protein TrkA n=1 Tax=Sandaracinus amylolyticus TaxID=927083 RepID=A0A0F6YIA4_9BACT|nr:TrkA family potassium uptake protein [Sandaracinus amylolyticus]AKF05951.1 Trk system potassium uptake protein TrkA [Sandaracinus amylolyticus]
MKAKKVLVIGVGRFGDSLIETLWQARAEIIAVDADPEQVEQVKDKTSAAFVGDATDPRVLSAIGADLVDTAVVTFGEDFEATVLCVTTLRKMGVKDVVARAATMRQAEVLRMVGASRVVQLEHEMGHRVAADLVMPVASDLLDFAHGVRVVPWIAEGKMVGKTLAQAELRKRWEIHVLGVRPQGAGGKKLEVPGADYTIAAGDTLLIAGAEASINRFVRESE